MPMPVTVQLTTLYDTRADAERHLAAIMENRPGITGRISPRLHGNFNIYLTWDVPTVEEALADE